MFMSAIIGKHDLMRFLHSIDDNLCKGKFREEDVAGYILSTRLKKSAEDSDGRSNGDGQ